MSEKHPGLVTQMLEAVSSGSEGAEDDLFNLVYDELRGLARSRMASERPGQTLQPTALVHEVYLRLLHGQEPRWANRAHFFTAAAEAMRRILIERARLKARLKRGGDQQRVDLDSSDGSLEPVDETLMAINHSLEQLERRDPAMATIVKLRYFAGLTTEEVAQALDISESTVYRNWTSARAWLHSQLNT
jgi:RNA polymerase sigma factor (TIGR02999 family)